MKVMAFDIGTVNMAYIRVDLKSRDIESWSLVDFSRGVRTTKKMQIKDIEENIFDELDKINVSNVSEILIENQPSMKNPKMKSVQVMISTYFYLKQRNSDSLSYTINLVSPSQKNKFLKQKFYEVVTDKSVLERCKKIKNSYSQYKKMSECLCEHFIKSSNSKWNTKKNLMMLQKVFYNDANKKKRDDLADTFIYCAMRYTMEA